MTVKLEKIETSVFDFNSGDENSDTPLSFVTRSGRKAKKTNPKVATREPENDIDDGDEDYKHVEGDGESGSESEQSVNNESENNNRSSGSDFEVKINDLST